MAEFDFDPKTQEKMSPEGEKAIAIFQEAIATEDLQLREKLIRDFYNNLLHLLSAPDKTISDSYLEETIVRGKNNKYGGLWIANGTSGERILFLNNVFDANSDTEEETVDGLVGWMVYPKPETNIGSLYWENFMSHFGNFRVALRKEADYSDGS